MKDIKDLQEENERLRKANLYLVDINNQLDDARSLQNDIIDKCQLILNDVVFMLDENTSYISRSEVEYIFCEAKEIINLIESSQEKIK